MTYIFKEKLNLLELSGKTTESYKVLTVGLEEDLGRLYESYLASRGLNVAHCYSFDAAHKHIETHLPHLVLINIAEPKPTRQLLSLLYQIKLLYPSLLIVSLGQNINHEFFKQIMSAGVCSHVDRRFSRPQDLVDIITTLLHK